jgi:hypothetical protein
MLVSSIKITSPSCDDHAAFLEAGGQGDHYGGVFFSVLYVVCCMLCVVCCVLCVCLNHHILYDTPPLVSGPVNSQICTKDSIFKKLLRKFFLLWLVLDEF